MIRAGAALASGRDGLAAVEEAAEGALARAGRADLAVLFATAGFDQELPRILERAVDALGTEAVVGASGYGVLAGGRDIERAPALALLVASGVEAQPFLVPDLASDEESVGHEIATLLGGPARAEDLVALLPDPRGFDAEALLAGVGEALCPARVVGAGAADPVADQPLQWCGRRVESGAVAGFVLRGRRPPRVGVTQACRLATGLLTVTRSEGHWIQQLDGRPALDVYREVALGPLASDLRRASSFVLVALPRDPEAPLAPGGYLVRNVAGFATDQKAFATPELLEPGDRIALVLREPEAARDDLKAMLERLGGEPPAFGLYFDCLARGSSLFGVPGLEAAYLESGLGGAPLAGMQGACEFGPIGGATELLTYTGVLALVDA